jgi:CDP-6-deoxy-D-xylo-4-hexulose-3-dehydrase
MKVKLIKSTFYNEQLTKEKLSDFIEGAEKLSMGEKVLEFENKFSERVNSEYSTMVNSGSSANLLLLQSLLSLGRISKGDKVAFSAVTWATNVMPILQLGLVPIPVDVELDTLNVSRAKLADVHARHTDISLLFVTNLLGFCHDLPELAEYCQSNEIILIEDNCESLGSRIDSQPLGGFGTASTCSFYVGHHLSTIEGGMVSTSDAELKHTLDMVRAHGWDRNLPDEPKRILREKYGVDEFFDMYTFYFSGFNLRPSEINGFLGCVQIEHLDEIIKRRQSNYTAFAHAVSEKTHLHQVSNKRMDVVSNFAFPLIFKTKKDFTNSLNLFRTAEIEVRPIVGGNITRQPFYRDLSLETPSLPNSDLVHHNGFYLPNNPDLTLVEVNYLLDALRRC